MYHEYQLHYGQKRRHFIGNLATVEKSLSTRFRSLPLTNQVTEFHLYSNCRSIDAFIVYAYYSNYMYDMPKSSCRSAHDDNSCQLHCG